MRRHRRGHRRNRTVEEVNLTHFQDGRRHRQRGRRRGRIFDHGDLRFLILHLIAENPRHGYEIIRAIEDQLGGSYSPSPGVVYPTLTMLEELGYATPSSHEDGRKLYAITREGTAYLEANKPSVKAILERIAEWQARHSGEPPPPLVRAMENLRLALSLRLTHGKLTETQVRAIARVIDDAAIAVERS